MVTETGVIGLGLLFFSSFPTASLAAGTQVQPGVQGEIRLNAGRLNGKSGEYVYDAFGFSSGIPGYKISELDWQLNDVTMVGIGASVIPNRRLRLNLDYWSNAGDGDGTMDDYDWLYVGLDWSHWSHHDNTSATEVTRLDINGELTLYESRPAKTVLTALFGYHQDNLSWESIGGYGIYSDIPTGYRDVPVIFPNVRVIAYDQRFYQPYIGIGVRAASTSPSVPVAISASFRYSNQVHGEDDDIHYLRALRFEESGDGGTWQAYDIRLDWLIDNSFSLNLAYAAQRYGEIKSSTIITDLTTGMQSFVPGDSAGLDHRSNLLSLGLAYRF